MPLEANPKPCANSIVNLAFDVEIRRATLLLNETGVLCAFCLDLQYVVDVENGLNMY